MSNQAWITVTKRNPCPICEHDGWCVVAREGGTVICMRVAKGSSKTIDITGLGPGYLHREPCHKDWPVLVHPPPPKPVAKLTTLQVENIHAEYRLRLQPYAVVTLADQLGVSVKSLYALRIGQSVPWDYMPVFAFPMVDGKGDMIGISFRREDGKRWSERGGRNGLFVPDGMSYIGPLLVVEGPTDTAAMYGLGYDVIGRPSCNACNDMLTKPCLRRDVVVVADDDPQDKNGRRPGYDGAIRVARSLKRVASTVKVIVPVGAQDSREWVNRGADRGVVDCVIDSTGYFS